MIVDIFLNFSMRCELLTGRRNAMVADGHGRFVISSSAIMLECIAAS